MKQIYSTAKEVLIWLGPDGEGHAKQTLSLLERLSAFKRRGAPEMSSDDEYLIKTLYSHRWFSRLWVIQEAILATTPVIYWGKQRIAWHLVSDSVKYLLGKPTPNIVYNALRMTFLVDALRQNMDHDSYKTRTAWLGHHMRDQFCSDPRDRVYAVLGLSGASERVVASIKPDYEKSVEMVYLDFARAMLESTDGLEILAYVNHGLALEEFETKGTASWVPDWTSRFHFPVSYNRFNASAGLDISMKAPRDRFANDRQSATAVRLNGFIFSTVQSYAVAGCSMKSNHTEGKPIEHVLRAWDAMSKAAGASSLEEYDAGEFLMAFHDVLAAGSSTNANPTTPSVWGLHFFQSFCQRNRAGLVQTAPQYVALLDDILSFCKIAMDNLLKYGWEPDGVYLGEKYSNICYYRSIFLTRNGCVGSAPPAMRAGDLVVVLEGGNVPFILRKQNDGDFYKLVGAAYVNGIMKGQAVRKWKKKGGQRETFEIR
jgi:hypothetical protein